MSVRHKKFISQYYINRLYMPTPDEILEHANSILAQYESKLKALDEEQKLRLYKQEMAEKTALVAEIVTLYEKVGEPINPDELKKESVATLQFIKDKAEKLLEKFDISGTDETSGFVNRQLGTDQFSTIMSDEEKKYEITDKVLDMISYSMGLPIATKEEKELLRIEHQAQGIIY